MTRRGGSPTVVTPMRTTYTHGLTTRRGHRRRSTARLAAQPLSEHAQHLTLNLTLHLQPLLILRIQGHHLTTIR